MVLSMYKLSSCYFFSSENNNNNNKKWPLWKTQSQAHMIGFHILGIENENY